MKLRLYLTLLYIHIYYILSFHMYVDEVVIKKKKKKKTIYIFIKHMSFFVNIHSSNHYLYNRFSREVHYIGSCIDSWSFGSWVAVEADVCVRYLKYIGICNIHIVFRIGDSMNADVIEVR